MREPELVGDVAQGFALEAQGRLLPAVFCELMLIALLPALAAHASNFLCQISGRRVWA